LKHAPHWKISDLHEQLSIFLPPCFAQSYYLKGQSNDALHLIGVCYFFLIKSSMLIKKRANSVNWVQIINRFSNFELMKWKWKDSLNCVHFQTNNIKTRQQMKYFVALSKNPSFRIRRSTSFQPKASFHSWKKSSKSRRKWVAIEYVGLHQPETKSRKVWPIVFANVCSQLDCFHV